MILQCKNAEMTILLSFLHFYSVKSYNFCLFVFSPIQIFFRLNKKIFFNNFIFIFFSLRSYFFEKKSVNQVQYNLSNPACYQTEKKIRIRQGTGIERLTYPRDIKVTLVSIQHTVDNGYVNELYCTHKFIPG